MRTTEMYNCLEQEKGCVGLGAEEMGETPLVLFCTGANAVAVFVLVWMSDTNGILGRSSRKNLG